MKYNRQFASDNYSGICPEAWNALCNSNVGHIAAYGDDHWTAEASDALRDFFETDCEVFFVFNGTAANSLALSALCQSFHSVICHEAAHIETDECGAPEFFSNGTKILLVKGANGKVDLSEIERTVKRRTDIHYPKPRALSISQATEVGTVYTVDEVSAIGDLCKRLEIGLHMDGARFANALVHLGAKPKEVTWQAGVDVLCFGGTKNGMAVGDAIIFFNKKAAADFEYRCKQAGQLASKMRFLSAPWTAMLNSHTWRRNAENANRHAKLLESSLRGVPGIRILFPCQANSVFAEIPPPVVEALKNCGWAFYTFIGVTGVRFMCSWDTSVEDVEKIIDDLREVVEGSDTSSVSPIAAAKTRQRDREKTVRTLP